MLSWRPRASIRLNFDSQRCSTSGRIDAVAQSSIGGRRATARRKKQRLTSAPLDLDPRHRCPPPPPASFGGGGGSFDPSEGLADAAEDLLRALRAEPESSSSGGSGATSSSAARRADELASDGMWPLYQALGDFADLLDLADKGKDEGEGEDEGGGSDRSFGGAGTDAEALSLLRSHPSLLLLTRSELATRLVLLKQAAGPGADAAALARRLPWLLTHADPGEVVRRAARQMLALMPGVGGPSELGARLFGSGGPGNRASDGGASQSWLTFCDIARAESRKLKVEDRERRGGREGER